MQSPSSQASFVQPFSSSQITPLQGSLQPGISKKIHSPKLQKSIVHSSWSSHCLCVYVQLPSTQTSFVQASWSLQITPVQGFSQSAAPTVTHLTVEQPCASETVTQYSAGQRLSIEAVVSPV